MNAKQRRKKARRNKQARKQARSDTRRGGRSEVDSGPATPIAREQRAVESKSRLGRVTALISLIRLKLRNKLGVWGSIASLVGLIGIPLTIYSLFFQPAPRLHVTLEDVFDNLKARDARFERDPLAARTFWLLREPGASITLGTCPGPECFQFTLGDLSTEGGSLIQKIFLSGEGFGIRSYPGPGLRFEMKYQIHIKGSALAYNPEEGKAWVPLTLARGNFFELSTPVADISLRVLDTRSDSLRIHLEARRGSYVPLRLQGNQPAAK